MDEQMTGRRGGAAAFATFKDTYHDNAQKVSAMIDLVGDYDRCIKVGVQLPKASLAVAGQLADELDSMSTDFKKVAAYLRNPEAFGNGVEEEEDGGGRRGGNRRTKRAAKRRARGGNAQRGKQPIRKVRAGISALPAFLRKAVKEELVKELSKNDMKPNQLAVGRIFDTKANGGTKWLIGLTDDDYKWRWDESMGEEGPFWRRGNGNGTRAKKSAAGRKGGRAKKQEPSQEAAQEQATE